MSPTRTHFLYNFFHFLFTKSALKLGERRPRKSVERATHLLSSSHARKRCSFARKTRVASKILFAVVPLRKKNALCGRGICQKTSSNVDGAFAGAERITTNLALSLWPRPPSSSSSRPQRPRATDRCGLLQGRTEEKRFIFLLSLRWLIRKERRNE